MENLESENKSLEFQVQSMIKERENVKIKYQKLFDSMKKTRAQTQGEINELIENVKQKTYAYADVRLSATSIVRRPSNRDSSFKNSVISNTKNSSKKVEVSDRTNIKPDVASKNVGLNMFVTNDEIKNALIEKNVLCVSCAKNVLIPCHDNCLAKYKLNVHSHVRRALFTTPRTVKSTFKDTTPVVSKTRFSVKTVQSMSLDTTPVVSKAKIVMDTPLSAKNKVSSVFSVQDSSLRKYMKNKIQTIRMWQKWLIVVDGSDGTERGHQGRCLGVLQFTWVYFLHSKDETSAIIKNFISQVQLNYDAKIHKIRTDNDTKFKNTTLKAYYEKLGIMQQFSTSRTPQKNGVVERHNRTLVEAARIMLIFSRLPKFLWAKAVSTACFTQNRSIIHTRHNKTPYKLLRSRIPNVEYFHVFSSLCYPINDRDDLGKMKPKADIGIFIGYSKTSIGFRIYNYSTKKINETIHVKFDELTSMASEQDSLEPVLQRFIADDSSAETMNTLSKEDLDNLFRPMYDEYFEKKSSDMPINSDAQQVHNQEDSSSTSSIDIEAHKAPPIVNTSEEQNSLISLTVADEFYQEDSPELDGNTLLTPYDALNFSEAESSTNLEPSNMHEFHQVQPSTHICTKAHPLEEVICDPTKPIMTRHRLQTDLEVCMYALTVSTIEPKNINEAMSDHSWIESMQDELYQFE
ncbi:retrovirus-related pol polyprotein from transposon TNT 1-94 [Tanacetum coccineum]